MQVAVASGSMGMLKRANPYVPIFKRMPARITLPAVGAWTCASGNHVCRGNKGTLMANPANNARNTHICVRAGIGCCLQNSCQFRDREGQPNGGTLSAAIKHDGQQSEKCQQAAGERKQKKFDGRVSPLLAAPDADQEEQWYQRELKEDVEQDHVPRRKHAQASGLQQQQHSVEQSWTDRNGLPTDQDARHHQDRRQLEQPQTQTVQRQVKAEIEVRAFRHPRQIERWQTHPHPSPVAGRRRPG